MNLPSQYFRAGAGAVIVNNQRLVLVLERAKFSGAWQLPQGGIEGTEEPRQTVLREISEETGINESDLELLDFYPEPLVYELPVADRSEKTGRGQVQYWFIFKFNGSDDSINIQKSDEFKAWQWIPFQQLLSSAVDFRKPVYQKIADRFEIYMGR
ncbi:MAG: RNA pyrophosphohydrolase [Thermosynechococcaceae cyanobacterium]